MKLIAVMPVRNEDWCLGLSARAALLWCDGLVIGLHHCTDRSAAIAFEVQQEYAERVVVGLHKTPAWTEMENRQELLKIARCMGATHIAIVDADEILTGNMLRGGTPWYVILAGYMLQLPGYNLRGSLCRYHSNGIWGQRWFSVAFRDDPRLTWSGDKFHQREPHGAPLIPYRPLKQGEGGVMHLWGVSERRLRAKHALYKVTERLRWPDKPVAEIERMYSWAIRGDAQRFEYGNPSTWTYADVPAAWWEPYKPLMKHLDVDAEPWQEAEVRQLMAEHGRAAFAGLDLFGVA